MLFVVFYPEFTSRFNSRAANIYGLPVKIRFLRWLDGIMHGYIKNYGFLMLKNVRFYYVNQTLDERALDRIETIMGLMAITTDH